MNNDNNNQADVLMDIGEEQEDSNYVSQADRYRSNKITDLKFTLCFEVVGALFFALVCIFRYDPKCQKIYDHLFIVFLTYIVIFRIPLSYLKLYSIVYLNLESRSGYFFTILSELFQLGWAIYANIIYYGDKNSECKFYVAAGIFMLYVYYVLYKVCIFIIVAMILIPCFLISYISEARERAKERRRKRRLMRRLVRERFSSVLHGEDKDCSICLEYFKEEQKIIVLPCDERHIYHSNCVKQWFLQDLTCPLCKDKIDINKINNQRNQRKNSMRVRSDSEKMLLGDCGKDNALNETAASSGRL